MMAKKGSFQFIAFLYRFYFFFPLYYCVVGDLMFEVYPPRTQTIICAKIKESKIFPTDLHDTNTNRIVNVWWLTSK